MKHRKSQHVALCRNFRDGKCVFLKHMCWTQTGKQWWILGSQIPVGFRAGSRILMQYPTLVKSYSMCHAGHAMELKYNKSFCISQSFIVCGRLSDKVTESQLVVFRSYKLFWGKEQNKPPVQTNVNSIKDNKHQSIQAT